MKVSPDWSITGTKEKIEKELPNFKFNGPGMYLTKTDTVLILTSPCTPLWKDGEYIGWKQKWPDETVFIVYVFNCPFQDTIYSQIALVPNRQDDR